LTKHYQLQFTLNLLIVWNQSRQVSYRTSEPLTTVTIKLTYPCC